MPLYNYICDKCGFEDEHLMSYQKSLDIEVVCVTCSLQMRKLPPLIAKTAQAWHSNWSDGLSHTYFSKALGRQVANQREEAKILSKAGFVSERDLPKYWFEDKQSKIVEKRAAQDQLAETYASKLAEGKSKETAIAETFTAEKCLSGELDSVYDEKITI
jgi:hypothetical protein